MPRGSTLGKLRENERKVRQEMILESAITLFEKKPFHEINMREIAKNIGISPASIYRFFSSRDDLFCEILIRELNEIKKAINQQIDEKPITIEEFAITVIDYLLEHEATFRMLCHFYMESNIDPKAARKFHNSMLNSEYSLETIIKKFDASGDAMVSTYAFFASLLGIVMCFYNYPDITLEEKRKLMHQVALKDIENFGAGKIEKTA